MSRDARDIEPDKVDEYAEHTGNAPGITPITGPKTTWKCRVCKFGYIDRATKVCVSCGRDWYGNPGTIPDADISTPRGRLFKRKRRNQG